MSDTVRRRLEDPVLSAHSLVMTGDLVKILRAWEAWRVEVLVSMAPSRLRPVHPLTEASQEVLEHLALIARLRLHLTDGLDYAAPESRLLPLVFSRLMVVLEVPSEFLVARTYLRLRLRLSISTSMDRRRRRRRGSHHARNPMVTMTATMT